MFHWVGSIKLLTIGHWLSPAYLPLLNWRLGVIPTLQSCRGLSGNQLPSWSCLGKQQESSQNKRHSYNCGNATGFRNPWERPNMFITVLYKLLNLWQINHQVHVAHVDMVFILYLWDTRGLHWRKEIKQDKCRWSLQGKCGIDLKLASKRNCLACSTEKPGNNIG